MRRGLVLVVVALLALPATASAATRYASPDGGIAECTQAVPCSLSEAIEKASANDEVIVLPGSYSIGASLEFEVPLTIRGLGPREKPRLVGLPGGSVIEAHAPATFRDLVVTAANAPEGALSAPADGTTFDRLEVRVIGAGSQALRPGTDFTLTNSLVVAEFGAEEAVFVQGIGSGAPQIRNSTLIAQGADSVALGMHVLSSDTAVAIAATNVIADAEIDASAVISPTAAGSSATIAFDHSAVNTWEGGVTSTAGQTASPIVVGDGNYHQAFDSPTIDAGVNSPANGELDLDGYPRTMGLVTPTCDGTTGTETTDIGAYEHLQPVPAIGLVCPPPTAAPQTRIVKAKIRKRSAKFRFTGFAPAPLLGFECKLDKRRWRPCVSPRLYKHLKPGKHRFKVRALSAAGADPTPAERSFRIKPRPRKSATL